MTQEQLDHIKKEATTLSAVSTTIRDVSTQFSLLLDKVVTRLKELEAEMDKEL